MSIDETRTRTREKRRCMVRTWHVAPSRSVDSTASAERRRPCWITLTLRVGRTHQSSSDSTRSRIRDTRYERQTSLKPGNTRWLQPPTQLRGERCNATVLCTNPAAYQLRPAAANMQPTPAEGAAKTRQESRRPQRHLSICISTSDDHRPDSAESHISDIGEAPRGSRSQFEARDPQPTWSRLRFSIPSSLPPQG